MESEVYVVGLCKPLMDTGKSEERRRSCKVPSRADRSSCSSEKRLKLKVWGQVWSIQAPSSPESGSLFIRWGCF